MIGHASDGDKRRRKLMLEDILGKRNVLHHYSVGWVGWKMSVSFLSNGDRYYFCPIRKIRCILDNLFTIICTRCIIGAKIHLRLFGPIIPKIFFKIVEVVVRVTLRFAA